MRRWVFKTEGESIRRYYTFAHRVTKKTIVTLEDASDEVLTATISEASSGERLDKVLPQIFPPYSRSQLQAWLKEGRVTLDGSTPAGRLMVYGGEVVSLEKPPLPVVDWLPEPISIRVVYEDSDIAVIDKPAGWGASRRWKPSGTLANALLYRFPQVTGLPRAGIVHRLDKDTSGLLVVALTEAARTELIRALEAREIKREYLAVVNGCPITGGTVDAPIGRHSKNRLKMAVTERGRPALTDYRVKERFRGHGLLAVSLQTGRTHQIRVHMSHAGFPLVGDPLYGGRLQLPPKPDAKLITVLEQFSRQALHARALALHHPVTQEALGWESPVPADLTELLKTLATDSNPSIERITTEVGRAGLASTAPRSCPDHRARCIAAGQSL